VIVILEGPNGAGKTTLANEILQLAPATRYIHASAPVRHPLVEYTSPIAHGKDYVLDRWHIGEMVYGTLYREKPGLTNAQFIAVEEFLAEHGAVVIHCNGPVAELQRRIGLRGGDESSKANGGSVTKLRTEAQRFDTFFNNGATHLPVFQSPTGSPLQGFEVLEMFV